MREGRRVAGSSIVARATNEFVRRLLIVVESLVVGLGLLDPATVFGDRVSISTAADRSSHVDSPSANRAQNRREAVSAGGISRRLSRSHFPQRRASLFGQQIRRVELLAGLCHQPLSFEILHERICRSMRYFQRVCYIFDPRRAGIRNRS